MARDQTVRRRIVEYLTEHGPVRDASGRATALLKEAVGYEGSDTGFTQLVSAMAKSGALLREVRGKRTYRVSLGSDTGFRASRPAREASDDALMDYDELAAALLARVTRILAAPSDASESASWARRRLEQLETRNTELKRDVARARADLEAAILERDALRNQLEAAQHNLGLLTERLNEPRTPHQGRAAERLGTDEQTLLYQLRGRKRPSTASPERVS